MLRSQLCVLQYFQWQKNNNNKQHAIHTNSNAISILPSHKNWMCEHFVLSGILIWMRNEVKPARRQHCDSAEEDGIGHLSTAFCCGVIVNEKGFSVSRCNARANCMEWLGSEENTGFSGYAIPSLVKGSAAREKAPVCVCLCDAVHTTSSARRQSVANRMKSSLVYGHKCLWHS